MSRPATHPTGPAPACASRPPASATASPSAPAGAPRRRPRLPRRTTFAALAALAALALGACGDSHTRVTTGTYAGSSGKNAPYLNVGPLVYEVQISRELNPYDTEDSSYLLGLTPAQRALHPGEEWFGVFMQVYNNSSLPHPVATNITITEALGNVYHPLAIGPTNLFAYRPGLAPADGRVPALNTVAADGPTQGALLLFKIKVLSLNNRPFTLKIVDPVDSAQTASAELDV
jgi:hypothetical protein